MVTNMLAFFAAPALLFQIAAATPACVLQAVNQQGNSPSDVKSICVNGSTVEQTLVSDCGDDYDAAMSAFSTICAGFSVTIAPWTSTSSAATQETSNAFGIAGGPTIPVSTTSGIESSSASMSASASTSGTEAAAKSITGTTVVTGAILTATDTVTSTQTSPTSSASTGAAGHVENSGLVMGAMAAAGLFMAL